MTHSVQEFLESVFGYLDLDWRAHVEHDPRYLRPTEVELLQGDATKARTKLGWQPRVDFEQLVEMMVDSDLKLARAEAREAAHQGG